MTIASVVDRWPDAARIFARYGLSCASCAISKSETILAGATGHGGGRVNMDELMRDLNTLADTGKLPDNLPAANATAGPGGMKMRGMAEQKGIKHVIAVMSGKGGVGKSLVAGLLAVGLKRRGFTVGILDGDITGPSIPRMLGVRENMSYVAMPDGSKNEVFGPSQGLKLVIASNAPLMAKLPIDPEIARLADAGLIESYESPESEELLANFIEVAPEKHPQVAVA